MSMRPDNLGPQPTMDKDGNMGLYNDGRTKQAFKDETDINKVMEKAQRAGSLSHLIKHGAHYGDFSDVSDLMSAHKRIERLHEIFAEAPSNVKKEFGNDAFAFMNFVNDPANASRLNEVLPDLARPGMQLPAVRRTQAAEVNPAIVDSPEEPSAASRPPDTADTSSTT